MGKVGDGGCKDPKLVHGELTPFLRRALETLATMTRLVRPGYFAALLWPDTRRTGAAMALPGGATLRRLQALGFARHVVDVSATSCYRDWGWEITDAGRKELRKTLRHSRS